MNDDSKRTLPPLEASDFRERARRRKRVGLGATVLVLFATLIGAFQYGRPMLEQHRMLLAQFPSLRESVDTMGKRMDAAEQKLRGWAGERDGLAERMANLESKMSQNLRTARKQAQEVAMQVQRRIEAELDRRTGAMQARLDQLESGQESERARVARLQEELAGVRQELAQQVTLARQDTSRDLDRVDQRLADLDQQAGRNREGVETLAHRLDRERVDFEVTKNHSREVAPGVSLGVTRTRTAYRRVDGWLWLLPDRRTLWVRNQNVQQPIIFYSKADPRPYELVITQVSRNSVAGYVLMPGQSGTQAAGPVAQSASGVGTAAQTQ